MNYEKIATALIRQERQRQIEVLGYSRESDREKYRGTHDLWEAALCYMNAHRDRDRVFPPPRWPWSNDSWKPSPNNPIRDFVKAGALLLAANSVGNNVQTDLQNAIIAIMSELKKPQPIAKLLEEVGGELSIRVLQDFPRSSNNIRLVMELKSIQKQRFGIDVSLNTDMTTEVQNEFILASIGKLLMARKYKDELQT